MLVKKTQYIAICLVMALTSAASAAPYGDFVSTCTYQFETFDKRIDRLVSLGWEKVETPIPEELLAKLAISGLAIMDKDGFDNLISDYFEGEKRSVVKVVEAPQSSDSFQSGILKKPAEAGISAILVDVLSRSGVPYMLGCSYAGPKGEMTKKVEETLEAQNLFKQMNRFRSFMNGIPKQVIDGRTYSGTATFFFYDGATISNEAGQSVNSDFSGDISTLIREE